MELFITINNVLQFSNNKMVNVYSSEVLYCDFCTKCILFKLLFRIQEIMACMSFKLQWKHDVLNPLFLTAQ